MLVPSSRYHFPVALIAVFAALFATVAQGMSTDAAAGRSADTPPEGLSQGDWQSIRAVYEHNRHAVNEAGTVVVGATIEDSDATGVFNDANYDNGNNNSDGSGAQVSGDQVHLVGGTVTGLEGDNLKLVMQVSHPEYPNEEVPQSISLNGSYYFSGLFYNLTTYEVTIDTQPNNPSQTCTVANGEGVIFGEDVTNVDVECTTDQFTVSGTVTGLEGNGLTLLNNGGDSLTITADGNFDFATPLDDLSDYVVTIHNQPTDPSQSCTVTNGTGTLNGADVTNVQVECTTDQFTVGGNVTGLEGSGLTLLNNGGDSLAITADGNFNFATPLDEGSGYDVTVASPPVGPAQDCSVSNGSGTINSADVSDVVVECAVIDAVFSDRFSEN